MKTIFLLLILSLSVSYSTINQPIVQTISQNDQTLKCLDIDNWKQLSLNVIQCNANQSKLVKCDSVSTLNDELVKLNSSKDSLNIIKDSLYVYKDSIRVNDIQTLQSKNETMKTIAIISSSVSFCIGFVLGVVFSR